MLRVAIIGTGGWADVLVDSVQEKSSAVRIAACHSRSTARREDFARRHDCRPLESFADALRDPGIDALILVTPHSTHRALIEAAAAAGKHVFCEKPLALTADDARAAAEACRRAGVVLAVGHNRRFTAAARRIKSMLENGEFGVVSHLEAQFSFPGALLYKRDNWRADPSENPGGAIASCGIHIVDTAQWLLGPILDVTAICRRRFDRLDLPDTTIALVSFESGPTGYLGTLFAAPYLCWLNIYGSRQAAMAELDADRLRLHSADATHATLIDAPLDPCDSVRAELEAFASACTGNAPYPIATLDAIRNVEVMEAIIRSAAEEGRRVEIGGG